MGVDVAEGMIKAFRQKLQRGQISSTDAKVSAQLADLGQIDLATLNDMSGSRLEDGGFDLIYSLLAFHHIPDPCRMLNQVLKDKFLKPGGRIVLMDYEQDPNKQIFHPIHLKQANLKSILHFQQKHHF